MMTVSDSIDLIKRVCADLAKPVEVDGMEPMTFTCSFAENGVTPRELADVFPQCPHDIREFWMIARTARLFSDEQYGQWGLVILDPEQAASTTLQNYERRGNDFVAGDLVIGRFLG